MAIILQKCRLLHTPKTGGSWAKAAVKEAGIAYVEARYLHTELDQCPGQGLFTMAFVRHPWTWWKSYWLFKRTNHWDVENRFDRRCMNNDFELFMLNVLRQSPGHCSAVFRRFVGSPGHEIDFIGKFENLADDLVRGLLQAGEQFDEQRLRRTPRRNVGGYEAFSTKCSHEIRRRVLDAEREALARFAYPEPSA